MKHWQKMYETKPHGWRLMLTWGQSFGFGLFTSGSWIAARCNGVDLMFLWMCVTISPPTPQCLLDDIAKSKPASH